jgi:cell division septum initiation protein DivIVA
MADAIDELIKEIAGKHGVAVSRDDPIMILQTINARLLEDSARAQQAMLERYKGELEALSARWSSDAKEKAERVLNGAVKASSNAMRERASETAAVMRGEIETALACLAVSLRKARMVGMLNVVASCITLLAVATALWVLMH